jgi:hypothetical protein
MERHTRESDMTPIIDEAHSMRGSDGEAQASGYRPPELFVIGKAVDLVQGYSYGKYSDGYTGYYWER